MTPKNKKRLWPPQAVAEEMERPIPEEVYPVLDTDLARDNLENDLPAADLEELLKGEEYDMAKQVMKRPQINPKPPKNEVPPVPELQGKAKTTKSKAKPVTER